MAGHDASADPRFDRQRKCVRFTLQYGPRGHVGDEQFQTLSWLPFPKRPISPIQPIHVVSEQQPPSYDVAIRTAWNSSIRPRLESFNAHNPFRRSRSSEQQQQQHQRKQQHPQQLALEPPQISFRPEIVVTQPQDMPTVQSLQSVQSLPPPPKQQQQDSSASSPAGSLGTPIVESFPSDFMQLSVFSAIFCCLLFGIHAVAQSGQCRMARECKDIEKAKYFSRETKIAIGWSFVSGVMAYALLVIFLTQLHSHLMRLTSPTF